MLILIEQNNGEQWEDYQHWIDRVYDIPEISSEIVQEKFSNFLVEKMMEANITINPHYFNMMEYSVCKNKSIYKQIMKQHGSIYTWIEDTYKIQPLKFDTLKNIIT
jgi:hypothetical protein